MNEVNFCGILCREDRKKIWTELGREISELSQISFKRQSNRSSQVLYKLKEPKPITELFKKPEFDVEIKQGTRTDIYTLALPDFADVNVELGKVVTVTAFKTIHLDPSDVAEWVELYGFIQGEIRITTDEKDGIADDDIEIDILLTKALPEILPIKGQRIKFYYPGIKTLCLKCYRSGHPKWECNQDFKTNWLEYVLKFYNAESISEEMLGSWVDTLKVYHPEFQESKPLWSKKNKDLRDGLVDSNLKQRNLHKFTAPTTNHPNFQYNRKPYLQPIGQVEYFQPQGYYQSDHRTQYHQNQDGYHQHSQPPRGRGRGRGQRGRGRGRGRNFVDPSTNPVFGNRRGQFYVDLQ